MLFAQCIERLRPVERQGDDAARIGAAQHVGANLAVGAVVHRSLRSHYPIAAVERARSRSWNFWILPVEVFGIGSKRISRGTL